MRRLLLPIRFSAQAARVFFALSFFLSTPLEVAAQTSPKNTLGIGVFETWPRLDNVAISNDGKYVAYSVSPARCAGACRKTLLLRTLSGDWKLEQLDAEKATFGDNSQSAVFQKGKDSLCVVMLQKRNAECLGNVRAFRLFKIGSKPWLAYQSTTPDQRLVLREIGSGV